MHARDSRESQPTAQALAVVSGWRLGIHEQVVALSILSLCSARADSSRKSGSFIPDWVSANDCLDFGKAAQVYPIQTSMQRPGCWHRELLIESLGALDLKVLKQSHQSRPSRSIHWVQGLLGGLEVSGSTDASIWSMLSHFFLQESHHRGSQARHYMRV